MKKTIKKQVALFLIMIIVCTSQMHFRVLAADTETIDREALTTLVDEEIKKLKEEMNGTGLVASVVTSDEILMSKGYGYVDVENQIKAIPDESGFRIGSTSKTITAIAVMQMVEAGKLDLDEPITTYLGNDFYDFKYDITLRNLLTHTAGFEEQNMGLFVKQEEERGDFRQQLIKYMPAQIYEPGTYIAYSNYGVAIAGYIVEVVSGMPYVDYTEKYIFKPLGMTSTTFDPENYKAAFISKGYDINGNEREEGKVRILPTGSVTSTADDMAQYLQFLLNDRDERILSKTAKQMLFDQQFTMAEEFAGIGLTWYRYLRNNQCFYIHSGGTDNFSTLLLLCKDADIGLFISSNSQVVVEYVGLALIKSLYGDETEPKTYDDAVIDVNLEGSYLTARQSYTHKDKVMNLFLNKVLIEGNKDEGFTFRGEPIKVVDEDTIFNKYLGVMNIEGDKENPILIESEGHVFLKQKSNETIEWYVRAFGIFTIAMIIGLILAIVTLFKVVKKGDKILMILGGVTILLSCAYGYFIYRVIEITSDLLYSQGDMFFALLGNFGLTMLVLGLGQIAMTTLCVVKRKHFFYRITYTMLSAATLLGLSVIAQLNLLW